MFSFSHKQLDMYSVSKKNVLPGPELFPHNLNEDYDMEICNSIHINEDGDVYSNIKEIRTQCLDKILIGQLNINSLGYKFEMLGDIVVGNLDILLVSQSKLDDTFTSSNFRFSGFSLLLGDLLLYIRHDIPFTILSSAPLHEYLECLFI